MKTNNIINQTINKIMKTTTGLEFNATKVKGNTKINVVIRLDDRCKNGVCDFSITCTGYEKAKNGHWLDTFGGCCHEQILKFYPEFADFVNLHLCDLNGRPMYAIENGLYWYNEKGAQSAADYLRISKEEAIKVFEANDKLFAGYQLVKLGIVDKWQQEAQKAIKHLENLTGKVFTNPYSKTTEKADKLIEEVNANKGEIENKINSGYYTPKAIKERKQQEFEKAQIEKRAKIEEDYNTKINTLSFERDLMLQIFDAFGTIENVIYYEHRNTIKFNWFESCSRKQWTGEEIQKAKNLLVDVNVNIEA